MEELRHMSEDQVPARTLAANSERLGKVDEGTQGKRIPWRQTYQESSLMGSTGDVCSNFCFRVFSSGLTHHI